MSDDKQELETRLALLEKRLAEVESYLAEHRGVFLPLGSSPTDVELRKKQAMQAFVLMFLLLVLLLAMFMMLGRGSTV